jgi:hypothetical protein
MASPADGFGHPLVFFDTFSSAGQLLSQVQYDPLPASVGDVAEILDVAGAPDGSFAALLFYADDTAPIQTRYAVLFSSLAAPDVWQAWPAPFSDYADGVHLAWDGEAFAIHAQAAFSEDYYLTRARWTAGAVELVTPTMQVGMVGSIAIDHSDFETDPVTGYSWGFDGWLLNAHDREGNLLPGAQAKGYGLLAFGPSYNASMAPHGTGARVAATDSTHSVSIAIDETFAETSPRSKLPQMDYSAIGFVGDEPSLFTLAPDHEGGSFDRFRIRPDGSTIRTTFVPYPKGVNWGGMPNVSVVAWQDEPWVGFYDVTGSLGSYRILRAHGACTYPSMYEVEKQQKK